MALGFVPIVASVFVGVAGGALASQALDNKPDIGTVNQPVTALPLQTIAGYTAAAVALLYAANSLGLIKK